MYTHHKNVVTAGTPLTEAKGALIMLHGRGAAARNILSLAAELKVDGLALLAPQATEHSWYPYSFMAPDQQNRPALESALEVVIGLVDDVVAAGIPANKIWFLGFSQGACLALEYITRNAKKYGGAIAFTGGLIGEELDPGKYHGNFEGSPVLITTGDPDPHVPIARVQASAAQLRQQGAEVELVVYKGRPHTITRQEIDLANNMLFDQLG